LSGRKRYQPFAERGFRPPFRKWAELEVDVFYKTQDKFDISYTEETLYLVQETVLFLANYLNDHGPFDGLLGFSQGTIAIKKFFHSLQYFSKRVQLAVEPPSFCIFFGGAHF